MPKCAARFWGAEMADILNALVIIGNFIIASALAYGSQLALGALGVTLVFGVLRFSNIAHGETMAAGAMFTMLFTWWLQSMGSASGRLPTALQRYPSASPLRWCCALRPTGPFMAITGG